MIRGLRADEIEIRVGQKAKDDSWYTLLLYKDSRCDMNILDELYPMKWQRVHKELKGNIYCGVGIWSDELKEWIWRWDCGTESNTEAAKGESSDSFKRACVNVGIGGIGRELYTAPRIFMNGKVDNKYVGGLYVSEIGYEETETKRTISRLVIKDANNKVAYSFGKAEVKEEPKDRESLIKELKKAIADNPDITEEDFCKLTKITKIVELETHRLPGAIKYAKEFK